MTAWLGPVLVVGVAIVSIGLTFYLDTRPDPEDPEEP